MKMLKKSLIAIAVLAIAMPVFAGQVKIHEPWPTELKKVEVCKIDVVMDVGFYIKIVDQGPIEVVQDTTSDSPYKTYIGCKTTDVISNFKAKLFLEAKSSSPAGGSWTGTFGPGGPSDLVVLAGTTNVEICAKGTGVDIGKLTNGGAKDFKVAEITVKVLPG